MKLRSLVRASRALALIAGALALAPSTFAQTGVRVAGRLQNSLSGDAVAGASIVIEELKLQATSAADGRRAGSRRCDPASSWAALGLLPLWADSRTALKTVLSAGA